MARYGADVKRYGQICLDRAIWLDMVRFGWIWPDMVFENAFGNRIGNQEETNRTPIGNQSNTGRKAV